MFVTSNINLVFILSVICLHYLWIICFKKQAPKILIRIKNSLSRSCCMFLRGTFQMGPLCLPSIPTTQVYYSRPVSLQDCLRSGSIFINTRAFLHIWLCHSCLNASVTFHSNDQDFDMATRPCMISFQPPFLLHTRHSSKLCKYLDITLKIA